MAERTNAAGQIWPHLLHDDGRVAKPSTRTAADALWPSLSREAKAEAARQARWQEERKARNKRMVENLDEIIDAVRREKAR